MALTFISNVEFIATLIHLKKGLTYTEILEYLQIWRGKPTHQIQRWIQYHDDNTETYRSKIRRNSYGTEYLSYSPSRGPKYKKVAWDNDNSGTYYLLPQGKKYVSNKIKTIDELFHSAHKSHQRFLKKHCPTCNWDY